MDNLSMIREFVINNYLFGDGERLKDDTSFQQAGIIDSTGILELIMFLEETFKIKVEDNELVPGNLDNLKNMAEFINRKTSSKLAGSA